MKLILNQSLDKTCKELKILKSSLIPPLTFIISIPDISTIKSETGSEGDTESLIFIKPIDNTVDETHINKTESTDNIEMINDDNIIKPIVLQQNDINEILNSKLNLPFQIKENIELNVNNNLDNTTGCFDYGIPSYDNDINDMSNEMGSDMSSDMSSIISSELFI